MQSLNEKVFHTAYGEKKIAIHVMDILGLNEELDVMTVSSFINGYRPSRGTVIKALYDSGISVEKLSEKPKIDLRDSIHVWLSDEITEAKLPIRHVACIELNSLTSEKETQKERETRILSSIQGYFHMLEIASLSGMKIEKIGLPILGTGRQKVSLDLIMIPMLNECIRFLENNKQIKEIHIITIDQNAAYQFAKALDQSYVIARNEEQISQNNLTNKDSLVFISYSSSDKNIADNLCAKLESKGMKVWYAPRDIVENDYASAIVNAITHCTHFVVILSQNSLKSQHVLNEIDIAFSELKRNIRFKPLKIDEESLGAAFTYYLSRQHWMDAHVPPLEKRLDEFVQKLINDN